jgi:hypothetical protein
VALLAPEPVWADSVLTRPVGWAGLNSCVKVARVDQGFGPTAPRPQLARESNVQSGVPYDRQRCGQR